MITIIACSRHIYMVLFFAHIPFMVNRTFSAMPAERLQHYKINHNKFKLIQKKQIRILDINVALDKLIFIIDKIFNA